jgi:hypothetical protein
MKSKDFDAVKMMRNIIDELSKKFSKMTIQEEMKELRKGLELFDWLHTKLEPATEVNIDKNFKSKVAEGRTHEYQEPKT